MQAIIETSTTQSELTLATQEFFIREGLYVSGVLLPSLDALSLKLRSLAPSFKKKKGSSAMAAPLEKLQKEIWNEMKKNLKNLGTFVEEKGKKVELEIREAYGESSAFSA